MAFCNPKCCGSKCKRLCASDRAQRCAHCGTDIERSAPRIWWEFLGQSKKSYFHAECARDCLLSFARDVHEAQDALGLWQRPAVDQVA